MDTAPDLNLEKSRNVLSALLVCGTIGQKGHVADLNQSGDTQVRPRCISRCVLGV